MFELSIIVNFEAAHKIMGYYGKCQRLHGHNWKVEVSVISEKINKLGMVIDFKDLRQEIYNVINELDHYCLNEIDPFTKINPTSENISKYLFEKLSLKQIFNQTEIKIKSVKVWESENSAVIYFPKIN